MMIWLPFALFTALLMEPWAAFMHGVVWHARLWPVHRSHHEERVGLFEANDFLSSAHVPFAVALILYGCRAAPGFLREVSFGVGVGMSVFGVAYFAVHDGFVHGRLPLRSLGRFSYFRRLRRAHRIHHIGHQAPYGFFLAPWAESDAVAGERRERHAKSSRASLPPHLKVDAQPKPRTTSP